MGERSLCKGSEKCSDTFKFSRTLLYSLKMAPIYWPLFVYFFFTRLGQLAQSLQVQTSKSYLFSCFKYHSNKHILSHLEHAYVCSVVSDSATLGTVDSQAPMSMGFFRQEYWSGLPFPPPGHLPDPGFEPESLMSPAGRQVLYHYCCLGRP